MSLSLIGAVGIRVRPETKGFKEETRAKVLEALRGYEADVPVVPRVKESEAGRVKERVARIAHNAEQSIDMRVDLDTARAQAEAEKIQRLLKHLDNQRVKVDLDADKAKRELEDLEKSLEDSRKGFEALDKASLADLENAQRRVADGQKEIEHSTERLREAEKRYAEATADVENQRAKASKESVRSFEEAQKRLDRVNREYAEAGSKVDFWVSKIKEQESEQGKASDATLRSLDKARAAYDGLGHDVEQAFKRASAAEREMAKSTGDVSAATAREANAAKKHLAEMQKALQRATADRGKAFEALERKQEAMNVQEREHTAELNKQTKVFEEHKASVEEMGRAQEKANRDAKLAHTILSGSTSELHEALVENQREGERFHETLERLRHDVDGLGKVDLSHLMDWAKRDFARDHVAHLRVELDSAKAEAELISLERSRVVRLRARLDSGLFKVQKLLARGGELDSSIAHIAEKYSSMFAGAASAVSGMGQITRMSDLMVHSAKNMDTLAVSASKATTVLSGLGTVGVGAVGWASALGNSLVKLAKGAAIAPAGMMALGVAVGTSVRAMQDLKAAIGGDEDALKMMPEAARPAIKSLGDMFTKADEFGRHKFFEQMKDQLVALPSAMGPVADMWGKAYVAQGKFFAGLMQGVIDWKTRGDMGPTMDHIVEGLENMSGAAKPFMTALLNIATVGSKYLPQLGSQVTHLAESWSDFIQKAKDSGRIDEWIVEAGKQVKLLGSALGSAVGVLGAFGKAASAAGYDGLGILARMMDSLNKRLNSPLWQSGMTKIFRGAYEGSVQASRGFGVLADSVMAMSKPLADMEVRSGKTLGVMAENIGRMVTNSRLLGGARDFIDSIGKAADRSGPMVRDMGDVFGDAATTAGKLVESGQMITSAFFRAWASMDKLQDGINAVIPVFGRFSAQLIDLIHVPLGFLSDGVGTVLQAFAKLPGPIQTAIMSLGLFLGAALKLKSMGGIAGAIGALGKRFPMLGSAIDSARGAMGRFSQGWGLMSQSIRQGDSFRTMQSDIRHLSGDLGKAGVQAARARVGFAQVGSGIKSMSTAFSGVKSSVGGAVTGLGKLGGGAKTAMGGLTSLARVGIGGLVSALGGPLGLALMAASALIEHFVAKQAEAKQESSELKATLTDTGEATDATFKAMADSIDKSSESYSGVWLQSKRLGEAMDATGTSAARMAADVIQSNGSWSDYRQSLQDGIDVLADGEAKQKSFSDSLLDTGGGMGYAAGAQEGLNKSMQEGSSLTEEQSEQLFHTKAAAGMTRDELEGLKDEWDKQANELKIVKGAQEEYAKTMGVTTQAGNQLHQAMQTINDSTSSAADKFSAFKSAMDVATGGTRSFLSTIEDQNKAMSSLDEAFAATDKTQLNATTGMVAYKNAAGDASYHLDTTKSSLTGLQDALLSSSDATAKQAQAMYDNAIRQGKTVGEAANIAGKAMDDWKAHAQQQLTAMGVDAGQAAKYLRDLTGERWQVELTFMGKMDQFMQAQQLVKQKGMEIDGQSFTAFLKANPGASMDTIKSLINEGVHWSSTKFEGHVSANAEQAHANIQKAIDDTHEFTDKDYEAFLKGDNSKFAEAYIAATAKGETFNDSNWDAKLGVDDGQASTMLEKDKAALTNIGSTRWMAVLDMDNSGFAHDALAAEATKQGLTGQDWKIYVDSNMAKVADEEKELSGGFSNLNGTTAEVSVKTNAAEQAIVMQAFELRAKGLNNTQIAIKLGVDADKFNTAMDGLPGQWKVTKDSISQAHADLQGDTDNLDEAFRKAREEGKSWAQDDYKARIGADDTENKDKTDSAKSRMEEFAKQHPQAKLGADDSETQSKTGEAKRTVNEFNSTKGTGTLSVHTAMVHEGTGEAESEISGVNSATGTGKVDVSDDATPKAQAAMGIIGSLANTYGIASLDANDNASPKAQVALQSINAIASAYGLGHLDAEDLATAKAQAAGSAISGVTGATGVGRLDATDSATPKAGAARSTLEAFSMSQGVGHLDATDSATPKTGAATSTLQAFSMTQGVGHLDATDSATPKTQAATQLGQIFGSQNFMSTLSGDQGPMLAAQGVAMGLGMAFGAQMFMAILNGNNGPMQGAQGQAMGLGQTFGSQNFLSTLSGDNGPMTSSQAQAMGLGQTFDSQDFNSTLSGDNGPMTTSQSQAMNTGQQFGDKDFKATLSADDQASTTISGLLSKVGQWAGHVFTAIFNSKHTDSHADGGFHDSMAFANGGIVKHMHAMRNVERYAPGGIRPKEVHTARIARPNPVYRVWAEPETGGEAYIPLADSKRGRSMEIFNQVANRFGVTVSEYANGGMNYVGGVKPRGGNAGASSGVNINYRKFARVLSEELQSGIRVNNAHEFVAARQRR